MAHPWKSRLNSLLERGLGEGKVLKRWIMWPLIGLAIQCATIALVIGLTLIFGDKCWAPRVGGLFVGFAVFAQGYVFANQDRFQRRLRSGITVEQRVMHVVYVASVLGTFLWALGDLVPVMWGVEVCKP
jgi:hypothetical protein